MQCFKTLLAARGVWKRNSAREEASSKDAGSNPIDAGSNPIDALHWR